MNKKLKFLLSTSVVISLLFFSNVVTAQDDSLEFELDDNLFDLDFAEPGVSNQAEAVPWYQPFTYKLSYQTITQINEHKDQDFLGNRFNEGRELENNRLSLLVKYQNAFASGWLLQGNAQAKLYLRQDYEYEANNNNTQTEVRLNELFIQRSFDNHSYKFGRQTVVWGEADGNSVLDVINTTEVRDLSIVNVEDARLNQTFLVWDWFLDEGTLSSFINLYPEFNPAVQRGSPLFTAPPFKQVDFDRDSPLIELGAQYRLTLTGSDIAVMAAYLYENQLRYDAPATLGGNGIAVENDYWLIGLSANKAIDKLLLIGDIVYSAGVFADTLNTLTFTPERHDNDRLGTSIGFEYGFTAQQQVTVSARLETFLDQDKAGANQQLVNDNTFGSYLVRYNYTSPTGDLSFSSTAQRDLDGNFFLASLGLNNVFDDYWSLFGQLVYTNATTSGPIFLDDDLRLELTLHYAF